MFWLCMAKTAVYSLVVFFLLNLHYKSAYFRQNLYICFNFHIFLVGTLFVIGKQCVAQTHTNTLLHLVDTLHIHII